MSESSSLPLFLASVVSISLSGVMMPGPVTAVTIAHGARHKAAGALVAVGHGLVEIPLIVLIYFGFAHFLRLTGVKIGVGLAGGLVLMWMALQVFRLEAVSLSDRQQRPGRGAIAAGLVTSATNPYFFVWWATIGAALLVNARDFGNAGVVAMGATHWLCDVGWLFLISWVVFRSKHLWTLRVHRSVFGVCALVLAGFGAWFIFSAVELAVRG
ncbi:MAG: lysine transporter LysE [Chloroflexi bacterium]|nr:lysine transporter LysE [Chloroflexota bacterium]